MQMGEFDEQMRRLNEAYRDYYTTDRLKTIWSVVSKVDTHFFERRVSKAMWADHPPKIDWFQNLRRDFELLVDAPKKTTYEDARDVSQFTLDEIHDLMNKARGKK